MSSAGWFVDPANARDLRYWDGQTWTQFTQPRLPGAPIPSVFQPSTGWAGPMVPYQVAPKNPAVSLLVSLFLPGVGSMINGDVAIGVTILLVWLVSIPLAFVFVGFLTGAAAYIWGLVDAYQGARRWNARHGIIS